MQANSSPHRCLSMGNSPETLDLRIPAGAVAEMLWDAKQLRDIEVTPSQLTLTGEKFGVITLNQYKAIAKLI